MSRGPSYDEVVTHGARLVSGVVAVAMFVALLLYALAAYHPEADTGTINSFPYVESWWYDGGAEDSGVEVYPDGSGVQYDGGHEVGTYPAGTFRWLADDEEGE